MLSTVGVIDGWIYQRGVSNYRFGILWKVSHSKACGDSTIHKNLDWIWERIVIYTSLSEFSDKINICSDAFVAIKREEVSEITRTHGAMNSVVSSAVYSYMDVKVCERFFINIIWMYKTVSAIRSEDSIGRIRKYMCNEYSRDGGVSRHAVVRNSCGWFICL